MVLLKKRDGRKEPFVPEKIVLSVLKSGAPPEIARMIAFEIEKNVVDGGDTQEIKRSVLAMLSTKNPEWERCSVLHDATVKKTFQIERDSDAITLFRQIIWGERIGYFPCLN
ncbi:MAG: ATP cone domain-containing protein [Methanobacteriota archaeon]